MIGARAIGWGTAIPEKVLTNEELAAGLGISVSWIEERTGIRSRHIASPGESTSSLATAAAEVALHRAEVAASDLDYVVVATSTPDHQIPATAPAVQHALGASQAAAFDIGAGCSGFLYALAQGNALIGSGVARRVLVCGADVLSRVTDYTDPKTCVLFADGAGAVVLEAIEGPSRLGPFLLRSDGARPELLWIPPEEGVLRMDGREVYRRAVDGMSTTVREILDAGGLSVDDINLLVAHQANARILRAVADRLGLSLDRVAMNIARYGNTSAASIPLALVEAEDEGRLHDDDVVVFTAFGAGFVWGAGLMSYGAPVGSRRELEALGGAHA